MHKNWPPMALRTDQQWNEAQNQLILTGLSKEHLEHPEHPKSIPTHFHFSFFSSVSNWDINTCNHEHPTLKSIPWPYSYIVRTKDIHTYVYWASYTEEHPMLFSTYLRLMSMLLTLKRPNLTEHLKLKSIPYEYKYLWWVSHTKEHPMSFKL